MKPIFLIGYMGSGKTTLGRALDRLTGMRFVDLDELIEQRRGLSVSEIFAAEGEDYFRRLEHDTLQSLSAETDLIVACGGGTPCFFDNMELMNATGITVFLNASTDTLFRRLSAAKATRPLIAGMDDDTLRRFIDRSLGKRMDHYHRAAHTFPSDHLEEIAQIEHTATEFINRFIDPNDR